MDGNMNENKHKPDINSKLISMDKAMKETLVLSSVVILFTILCAIMISTYTVNTDNNRIEALDKLHIVHETIVEVHSNADEIEIGELEEKEAIVKENMQQFEEYVLARNEGLEVKDGYMKLLRRLNKEVEQFNSLAKSIKEYEDIWYEHTELEETIEEIDYMLISSISEIARIR